jgi:hypothetical protein
MLHNRLGNRILALLCALFYPTRAQAREPIQNLVNPEINFLNLGKQKRTIS